MTLSALKRFKAKPSPIIGVGRRALGHPVIPTAVSGEELFANDVERLNAEDPGWDEPVRVADARRRLEGGMPIFKARAIFGKATVNRALQEIELTVASDASWWT